MTARRDYIIVIVILAIGWAFWLHRMGVNDHDDMLSNELTFAGQSVATLVFRIPWPDQSPFYFLYLRALRAVGESPFALQFANAVLLTLTLAGTYLLALAFSASRAVASAAIAFGALSPTSLWLVRNGRMYSLQLLFSVLAALLVVRYLEQRRARDLVAFSAVSLLNIYTHFFGFLITALLFVTLVANAWLEARQSKAERLVAPWRPLRPLAGAALALLVLSLPQVLRVVSLVTQAVPAARADVSLPALSPQFFDRVSWFWFVNANWGPLRPGEQLVTAVYIGSIVVLAGAGLALARRRLGVTAALWILLPLAAGGLAASRIDVRDRYFVWTLPLLWIAVATGGFGALPSRWLKGAGADIVRGVRAALVVAVTAGSVWLLWNKLPERYAEWTKLMTGVEHVFRPSMVVYMPPGSPMGNPRRIAIERHLPAALQDVRELSASTHEQFLREVKGGQEFVFLVYSTYENDEMRWRALHLEEHGYRRTVLPVYAASAHVFTREDLDSWSREQRLTPGPSAETIVAWARQQAQGRPTPAGEASALANAFVARVHADGVARVGRVFSSQQGEYGAWRLGPQEWDAVEELRTSSGRVEQSMIGAHPETGSVLVVASPRLTMKRSLELTYGIADTGLTYGAGAAVEVGLYVNGQRTLNLSCPNTPGWKTVVADTAGLEGQTADVVLLVTTRDDTSRHFAYRLDPSSQPARPSVSADQDRQPFVVTGGRRLSDTVEQLRVYRLEGDRRIDAQPDGRTYSAADMHEATGSAGEGAVHRVWALGPLLWDSVGSTRQPSGGEARKGIWAHPRNGTTLVIEASRVRMSALLRGYFGFTDFSVDTAKSAGVEAPVTFQVSIDGRPAFDQAVMRASGWSGLALPAGGGTGEHNLRIEIRSASDAWAHFVFDLWSD